MPVLPWSLTVRLRLRWVSLFRAGVYLILPAVEKKLLSEATVPLRMRFVGVLLASRTTPPRLALAICR